MVLIVERNIQNILVPYSPKIFAFVPNIYEGEVGKMKFQLDIVKIGLAALMTVYTLYRVKTLPQKRRWRYLVLEVGALDTA
jgi:hypothetical protein